MTPTNPSKPTQAARLNASSKLRLLLFSLIALFLGVHAVQARLSSPVLLYCPAYSQDVRSVYLQVGRNDFQNAALSTANVIELPAAPIVNGRITLYGPAGEDGEHPIAAIAEIGSNRNPLIVLYPSEPDAETPYQAVTVNADLRAFPLASFQLVNLSPYPIRFNKDEARVTEMQSGDSHNFKPTSAAGTSLAIRVKYQIDGTWALLSSSNWVARNDRRTLVCILRDPHTERMDIRSVPLREIPRR